MDVTDGASPSTHRGMLVGSVDSSVEYFKSLQRSQQPKEPEKPKPLVNPFNLTGVNMKLTSNRRRWTHAFPLGPSGSFVQQHHYQSTLTSKPSEPRHYRGYDPVDSTGLTGWGPTGEQEWTPALQTGVDWKSLVIPACLPLTTDYFPDPHTLVDDFTLSDYRLLPEDIPHVSGSSQVPREVQSVYQELICQRLQQGFQIVTLPPHHPYRASKSASSAFSMPTTDKRKISGSSYQEEETEECLMSIGAIFHSVQLQTNEIGIKQYKPRQASPEMEPISYRYQFTSPGNEEYTLLAKCVFYAERLETFNWNYLDHYICGEREYFLHKTNKFWRFRMLLLPGCPEATKSIQETSVVSIYSAEDKTYFPDEIAQREGVLKFLEILNKIKPTPNAMKNLMNPAVKAGLRRSSFGQVSQRQDVDDACSLQHACL